MSKADSIISTMDLQAMSDKIIAEINAENNALKASGEYERIKNYIFDNLIAGQDFKISDEITEFIHLFDENKFNIFLRIFLEGRTGAFIAYDKLSKQQTTKPILYMEPPSRERTKTVDSKRLEDQA